MSRLSPTSYKLQATTFAILLGAVLVGQRLGFAWAGGTGYNPERNAGVIAMMGTATIDRNGAQRNAELWKTVARGETVRTGENVRAKLQFNFADTVALDQNTDVTIEENNRNGVRLRVMRGRIYIETRGGTDWSNTVSVDTNRTRSTITTGALSVVNYDFLQKISVAPVGSTVEVVVDGDMRYSESKATDINEATGQVNETVAPFDPTSGAAAEFYAWSTH